MTTTRMVACLFFCIALTGCSNIQRRPLPDLCSLRLGACGALSLDLGECETCEVNPTEEKVKELHNLSLKSHSSNELGGTIGLKATWRF